MLFDTLIKALSEKLGLELVVEKGVCAFEVDGVVVFLQNLEENEMLLMHADLGQLPPEGREKLYRTMLEANHLYRGTSGATLSCERNNEHFQLQRHDWLQRLDEQTFFTLLDNFLDTVKFWYDVVGKFHPDSDEPIQQAPGMFPAPELDAIPTAEPELEPSSEPDLLPDAFHDARDTNFIMP